MLVSFSNGLLQTVDLDFARQFSQIARVEQPPAMRAAPSAKRSRTARRSRPVPAGTSASVVISTTASEAQHVKRLADDRVLDLEDPTCSSFE
jgi:hypothetical protein